MQLINSTLASQQGHIGHSCPTASQPCCAGDSNVMTTTQDTPFITELRANIRKYIGQAKRDGTVGMSVDNLIQCVKTPKTTNGAPAGVNIQWQYRLIFREVLASMTFKGFTILKP
jgi:hypothetical protein